MKTTTKKYRLDHHHDQLQIDPYVLERNIDDLGLGGAVKLQKIFPCQMG